MSHPTLSKLGVAYVDGSAWTPADFNRFSRQAGRLVDFFNAVHDSDQEHAADPLIPREAVICTYAAGTYTPTVATAGISAVNRAAAGNVAIQFDPDFPAGATPTVVAFPVVQSTERVYAYQDGTRTNDNTEVSFTMFDTSPAFVDRDFIAFVFAPRR